MIFWFAAELPALCVVAALLELDATCVGQWMVSRPLVLAPLLGWLCGSAAAGVSVGILMELITLDDLPVGSAMPLNATVAAASAVLLASGPFALEPAAAFPAGIALGGAFSKVEVRLRSARARLSRSAEAALNAGRLPKLGRFIAMGWTWQAVASGVFLYATVAAMGPILSWGWYLGPAFVRQGLSLAFASAQCLGWATALFALRPR
ncbi:MAG: PTS sugar transporter subunit IIC [Elusimicrobia bacterium]|nr:PTS sugar transporter subunit IIC [Elusimicrobiota bacterium]